LNLTGEINSRNQLAKCNVAVTRRSGGDFLVLV
jgi:hypothetical protein